MTLTIQDLGALGELLGSVLVALTLIYLAVQMRQNTEAANIQATGSLSSEIEQAILVLAQDDVLAEGAQKALNGEDRVVGREVDGSTPPSTQRCVRLSRCRNLLIASASHS